MSNQGHIRRFEIGRYHVDSASEDGIVHLVDFSDKAFPEGRCSCHDYQIRVEPYVARHIPVKRETCKHIESVKRWLRMMATRPE